MFLVLCEKYSQAEAIAKAFGLPKRTQAYEGNVNGDTWLIAWASGHLIEQVTPDIAKPGIDWNSPDSLLPVPSNPPMQISSRSKDAIDRIKSVAKRCDHLIISTDPDREGEGIGREIVQFIKFKPKTTQRLWLVAGMDEASIKKAALKLKDGSETEALWRAQQARSTADWLSQLTTRLFTMAGRRNLLGPDVAAGAKAASVASVGRVQTPTLNIIVTRDIEIEDFKPRTYYIVSIEIEQGGDNATLNYYCSVKPEDGVRSEGLDFVETDKGARAIFTDKAQADAFVARLKKLVPSEVDVTAKARKKLKHPPRPFSLTRLQQDANRRLRMTAKSTLEVAQSLYSAGYLSYPRTEHEFLPKEAFDDAPDIMAALSNIGTDYEVAKTLPNKTMPKCYTTKAMEHHGIMPTTKVPHLSKLSDNERNVYLMVVQRYIETHMPPAEFSEVMAYAAVPTTGILGEGLCYFTTKGEAVVNLGWMAPFQEARARKSAMPKLVSGKANLLGASQKTEKTKAPARFTEASLLEAMKNAGKFAEDSDAAKLLKSVQGIGTPATRDSIIETLLNRVYMRRDGKYLVSTPAGRQLITHLPNDAKSVEQTAKWESLLGDMAELSPADAIKARDEFIEKQVQHVTDLIVSMRPKINAASPRPSTFSGGSSTGKPSPKQIKFAESLATKAGTKPPRGYKSNRQVCSDFITKQLAK